MAKRRDFGWIISHGTPTHPSFSVRWMEGGKARRKRGFRTKTAAQDFLALKRISAGGDEARRDEITLAAVGKEWLEAHSAVKLRSHDDNVQRWARLEEMIGGKTLLRDVSAARIMEVRAKLKGGGLKPASVNRYLALLRTVLGYSVSMGYLDASPVRRFGRGSYLLPEPRPMRNPPLASKEEAVRLLSALNQEAPHLYGLFAFLLLTGARRGEAAGLQWQDVDLSRRLVTIRRSYDTPPKSGKARTVPIPTELAQILTRHRARDPFQTDVVFPHPKTGGPIGPDSPRLGTALDAACKRAGLTRMRVHDLRHAAASLWLMAGGTLADVERNLGHSTPVITSQIYGHLAEDHRIREADARLSLGLPNEDEIAGVAPLRVVKDGA